MSVLGRVNFEKWRGPWFSDSNSKLSSSNCRTSVSWLNPMGDWSKVVVQLQLECVEDHVLIFFRYCIMMYLSCILCIWCGPFWRKWFWLWIDFKANASIAWLCSLYLQHLQGYTCIHKAYYSIYFAMDAEDFCSGSHEPSLSFRNQHQSSPTTRYQRQPVQKTLRPMQTMQRPSRCLS